jgi:membrane protein YqaA with SNARE-associated domain
MRAFSRGVLALFGSPAGVVVLAALDSTVFFSLPFGIDAAVVVVAARDSALAWAVPLLATAGSIGGALLTFWMGEQAGEKGLERYISARRLVRVRSRIEKSGAIALAMLDLIPPPFPFTLFVLAAGTVGVRRSTFFATLTVCRLARFGLEALLAAMYGRQILALLEFDRFPGVVAALIVLGAIATLIPLVKNAPHPKPFVKQRTF